MHHTLAETAPGPSLSKEDALARAEAFLHESKGLDLTQWRVVETTSNRLPARTDHRFTWEQTLSLAATPNGEEGAHVRVELRVQGEELSHYRTFVHVSEDWMRKQAQTTLAGTAQLIGLSLFVAAFAVAVLVVFFHNLKQRLADAVPWRRLAGWSLAVLAATVVTFATGVPQFLFSYSTDQPFHTFLGRTVIELSLGAGLRYALVLFLFGLAWFFLTRAHGAERLPGWRGMPPLYYRDAFLVALGGSLALIGLGRLPELAGRIWPVLRHAFPARVPQELDFSWPAAYVLGNAVTLQFHYHRGTCTSAGLRVVLFATPLAAGVLASRIGRRDGFAVGEPWRSCAANADRIREPSCDLVGLAANRAVQSARLFPSCHAGAPGLPSR